ncbi:hypothetical protein J2W40_002001 [Sphingobium xenophagum]|uniref:Uncharacterized protein n=1 Tax=Sphingobium xenophagum TaxID=121428 RepID=A0ABU1X0W4_SPHXE|nr:hypothetical protein [Sphingobium xenophagum]MDR7155179.1 hypothetical protein [Sphingobium xenophagum]
MSVTVVPRDLLREAYDLVLAQWPDVIEPGEKTFHLDNGCNMRRLNEVHDPIEDWAVKADFRSEICEIIGSVEHYVFTSIHNALRNLNSLQKRDLDFDAFVSRFDGHPNFKVTPSAAN